MCTHFIKFPLSSRTRKNFDEWRLSRLHDGNQAICLKSIAKKSLKRLSCYLTNFFFSFIEAHLSAINFHHIIHVVGVSVSTRRCILFLSRAHALGDIRHFHHNKRAIF